MAVTRRSSKRAAESAVVEGSDKKASGSSSSQKPKTASARLGLSLLPRESHSRELLELLEGPASEKMIGESNYPLPVV